MADGSYGLSMLTVFFFNDTATTEIYTLSLHDALPISMQAASQNQLAAYYMGIPVKRMFSLIWAISAGVAAIAGVRSEEHTSELQSQSNLVCRLLLEKTNWHEIPA